MGLDDLFHRRRLGRVVLSVLLFFVVKDSPYTGDSIERIKVRALARTLAEVWDNPGTRLGLWVHFDNVRRHRLRHAVGYPFRRRAGPEPGDGQCPCSSS